MGLFLQIALRAPHRALRRAQGRLPLRRAVGAADVIACCDLKVDFNGADAAPVSGTEEAPP
jgi:hypothetical protein